MPSRNMNEFISARIWFPVHFPDLEPEKDLRGHWTRKLIAYFQRLDHQSNTSKASTSHMSLMHIHVCRYISSIMRERNKCKQRKKVKVVQEDVLRASFEVIDPGDNRNDPPSRAPNGRFNQLGSHNSRSWNREKATNATFVRRIIFSTCIFMILLPLLRLDVESCQTFYCFTFYFCSRKNGGDVLHSNEDHKTIEVTLSTSIKKS